MSDNTSIFSPLPWMQKQFSDLQRQHRDSRFPHALMIEGPEGSGKRNFARALAAFLLCERNAEHAQACGMCKHCELLLAGSHGDLREIEPEEGAKQIKVDAIRALSEFVAASSMLSGRKVVILDPVGAMNINAANALLKTLEEPAGDTTLLLISHAGGQVMPTIRSRCQSIKIANPSSELIESWLESSVQVGAEDLERVMAMSPGAPLRMKENIESGQLAEVDAMLELLSKLLKRECTISEVAETWSRDVPIEKMRLLTQWLAEICKLALTGDKQVITHSAAEKMFVYLAGKHSVLALNEMYQESVQAIANLKAGNNLNPVLIFEQQLGKWQSLMSARTPA